MLYLNKIGIEEFGIKPTEIFSSKKVKYSLKPLNLKMK